jgi:hypothetical protein
MSGVWKGHEGSFIHDFEKINGITHRIHGAGIYANINGVY